MLYCRAQICSIIKRMSPQPGNPFRFNEPRWGAGPDRSRPRGSPPRRSGTVEGNNGRLAASRRYGKTSLLQRVGQEIPAGWVGDGLCRPLRGAIARRGRRADRAILRSAAHGAARRVVCWRAPEPATECAAWGGGLLGLRRPLRVGPQLALGPTGASAPARRDAGSWPRRSSSSLRKGSSPSETLEVGVATSAGASSTRFDAELAVFSP